MTEEDDGTILWPNEEFKAILMGLGFSSYQEWTTLISGLVISTQEQMDAFERWKSEDGSKEGLLKLMGKIEESNERFWHSPNA